MTPFGPQVIRARGWRTTAPTLQKVLENWRPYPGTCGGPVLNDAPLYRHGRALRCSDPACPLCARQRRP